MKVERRCLKCNVIFMTKPSQNNRLCMKCNEENKEFSEKWDSWPHNEENANERE